MPPPFGLGYSIKQLRALLQLQHPGEGAAEIRERMDAMRAEVARLIADDRPAAAAQGRPEKERGTFFSAGKSDTKDKVVARLKRDDPNLAERVVNGEITANAAAEGGIDQVLRNRPDSWEAGHVWALVAGTVGEDGERLSLYGGARL